jgi:hypothetical protein
VWVKKAQLQANSGTWIVSEFACVSSGSFSRQIGHSILLKKIQFFSKRRLVIPFARFLV